MTLPSVAEAAATPLEDYNPAHVIEAVNALRLLGKDNALSEVEAYADSHRRDLCVGLFWVLRVLFDLEARSVYPPVRIGRGDIPPPDDPHQLPRFPIVIVRDVPFLAVSRYVLAGKAESVSVHIDYFRTYGSIRQAALVSPASLEGIEGDFLAKWKLAYDLSYVDNVLETVGAQVARLAQRN